MKPAPRLKPRRVRALVTYTVPASEYHGLDVESEMLRGNLFRAARFVKSVRMEIAVWGSGNGNLVSNNKANIKINKTEEENSPFKSKRHIDFGSVKPKKRARYKI